MPLEYERHHQHEDEHKHDNKRTIIYRVTSAGLSPDTRRSYEIDINHFLNYFQIKDVEPLKAYSLNMCKQMIIEYVIHLREVRKLTRGSIKTHLYAIRYLFFMIREDEFPIRWTKINIELPPNEYAHRDRGYSRDEIRRILEFGCKGRIRERVVILLLTSAGGMRIGAIPKLKKGDLKEMRTSEGEKTYGIRVYSESAQDYFTPCSPECCRAIDQYFEERTAAGEVLKYESPLIRNLYNSLNVKHPKPLTLGGIRPIVRNAVRLSGVRDTFEFKGQVQTSRGFRKFYKSEADLSGMVPATVELTQGHSIGVPGHYLRPKDTDILHEYEKVIDRITVDDTHRLRSKVKKLEIERDKAMEDYHEEWLAQLKKEYSIVTKSELGDLVSTIDMLQKKIPDLEIKIGQITTTVIEDEDAENDKKEREERKEKVSRYDSS
jgi:site-specific recombinase XerD